jgi:hypothetical protein
MTLFDAGTRIEMRFKGYSEPDFAYLNLSGRPSVSALRPMLEEWFQHFPLNAQADMRSRFRSASNTQHQGAFFELYIHELLISMDCTVTVHPVLATASTHPDFLARHVSGVEFYVEATLAGIPANTTQGADARIAQVYDVLERMDSPNFFLHLDVEGSPSNPPPASKLRGKVQRWLTTLDPDQIASKMQANRFEEIPRFEWEYSGWKIVIMPIAKSIPNRGKPGIRPIGVICPEAEGLQTDRELKAALETKAYKYGELGIPLLIAVNVLSVHCDDVDLLNALLGQESLIVFFDQNDKIVKEKQQRKHNGFWFGSKGVRNQIVSGVLTASNLNEWSMGVLTPELFHNPWATRPFNSSWWPMSQRIPNNATRHYLKHEGKTAGEMLRVPNPWPPSWD